MSRLDALIAILEILESLRQADRMAVLNVLESMRVRGTLELVLKGSREQGEP